MSEVLLKQRAEEIRDETQKGANTAERIGGLLVDIVDGFSTLSKENEELKRQVRELTNTVNKLSGKLDEFMGFTYIENLDFPAEGGTVKIGVKTTCKEWEVT